MFNLEYVELNPSKTTVKYDGRVCGHIHKVGENQYQYRPLNTRKHWWGDILPLTTIKDMLEIE